MPDVRERLLRPRTGWLSLGLLAVMTLALAWSVQGAGWFDQLEFLAPVALSAVVAGALLGVLPISIVVTFPVSALMGGLIVLWAVGGEYHVELTQVERFARLSDEFTSWTRTVIVDGYAPYVFTPYAIGLGLLMWTTGYIAAHVVFRYQRVLDAIVLVGVLLVANMSGTYADLFGHLVLFVMAALLLWLRASLVTRQESWQRRRVNENLEVPASIMRSGILFAAGSVALAWFLTAVAVAAPLSGAWRSLDTVWEGARDGLENVFGNLTNPQSRITGESFGSSFAPNGSWVSNDEEVMVITATRRLYMRTATYDRYTGRGFERTDGTTRRVEPGEFLFSGETPERPNVASAFSSEFVTVEMRQSVGRNLFAPGYPLQIFAPTVVLESGGQPVIGGLDSAGLIDTGQAYQVSAAISEATKAQLAAAGTEYPETVRMMYLDTLGVPDSVRALAVQVAAGAANPYEQAEALESFLQRDPSFTYATDAPVPAPGEDLVEFFLAEGNRTGYCQYYAAAFVVMARSLGLPARVAAGFAPGERQADGTFLVREANAHAWAEVYFPGYGWQIFEATKSIDPGFVRVSGDPLAPLPEAVRGIDDPLTAFENSFNATPPPAATSPPLCDGCQDARGGADQSATGESSRGANALIFLIAALGLLTVLWFRRRAMYRRWRFLPAGDRAWRRLSLAAQRAGIAPRPSETIYEYSGWLEDQIPSRRPEIRTLADGKVWQAYSGRQMGSSMVERLEAAWQRLRVPLGLLTLRRWVRNLLTRRI